MDGDKTQEKLYFFTKHGLTDGTRQNKLLVSGKDKNESLPNSGEKQLRLSSKQHGGYIQGISPEQDKRR